MDEKDRKIVGSTKLCPLCGEEIKRIALRCKHCHTDLQGLAEPDFNRGLSEHSTEEDFEQRFLEFAYQTRAPIHVLAVAHALKLPTAFVAERLEELAARDMLVRQVDDEGNVFFAIPGHTLRNPPETALAPLSPTKLMAVSPPSESTAVAAMVLNVMIPGSGSLVAGRVAAGIAQLMLWVIGVPLSFVLVGIPLVMASWIWSLMTGVQILEEAKRRQSPQ